MPRVENYVLTNGLTVVDSTIVAIYLCSTDPQTYAEATTTGRVSSTDSSTIPGGYAVAYYSTSAGGLFGSPAASTTNGRQVSSVAVSGGIVLSTGLATYWAAVTASTLAAHGALSAASTFTSTTFTWSMPSFTITLPYSSS